LNIRLTDGTILSSTSFAPSKRRNKATSGRQGRKTYNGLKSLSKVGGYKEEVVAIGQDVITPLCYVRTPISASPQQQRTFKLYVSKKDYTWNVGGSCSTGYIGGRGA
jgi:hypothetical protein